MKLHVVVVRAEGALDEPWVHTAWDESSIEGNEEGWKECVEDAEREFGVSNVRVVLVSVPNDTLRRSFAPRVVIGEVDK